MKMRQNRKQKNVGQKNGAETISVFIFLHLAALARQSLVFTHHYASAPVCSPSRAGLLTGRVPTRTNINLWINDLSDSCSREASARREWSAGADRSNPGFQNFRTARSTHCRRFVSWRESRFPKAGLSTARVSPGICWRTNPFNEQSRCTGSSIRCAAIGNFPEKVTTAALTARGPSPNQRRRRFPFERETTFYSGFQMRATHWQ